MMRGRDVAVGAGAALLLAWLIGGRGAGLGGPAGGGSSSPGPGGSPPGGGGGGGTVVPYVIRCHGTMCTVGGLTSSGATAPDVASFATYDEACSLAAAAVAADARRRVEVYTANGQQDLVSQLLACLIRKGIAPIQVDQ